jgi:hypothetical protein
VNQRARTALLAIGLPPAHARRPISMGNWWLFFAIGFIAQLIDGALGLAYGVLSNELSGGNSNSFRSKFVVTARRQNHANSGMSALGQKRTLPHVRAMSALPPKADIEGFNQMFAKGQ